MKILLFVLMLMTGLFAATQKVTDEVFPIATIMKIDGKAKILPANSIKKHRAIVGEGLLEGDRLIAYAQSSVLVTLLDNSKIVINENAELLLNSNTQLTQERGEVYYRITKRTKSMGLQVNTPFSIIGIKGTELIVNFENEGRIALNKGLIGITSPGADFELYKEKVLSDFEKYQREQKEDFDAYKRKLDEEIAAYVKSFELQSHRMLTFGAPKNCKEKCEKQVVEDAFSPEVVESFKRYQMLAGE